MKKLLLAVSFIVVFSFMLKAQPDQLMIRKGDKGLYLEHKVTPKENFYSVGRSYNVHPKHIASYNSLDMSKGLNLGQLLRIPLTDTNFSQKSNKGVPVFYTVGEKEGLSGVSANNNKVLLENLRTWNKLPNDNVTAGKKLIVGFLVTSGTQSALTVPKKDETTKKNNEEINKKPDIVKNEVINKPELKNEEIKEDKTEQKKEESKDDKIEPKKEETKPEKIEVKKTEEIIPVKEEMKVQPTGLGYFRTSFDQQVKQKPVRREQTVTSGIFKTASGWSDSKYYLLMDGIDPGTIVRITNPTNNKILYAKVLGEMNGLKQNQGLNIRISNAAAAALDIAETDKFIVKVNY
jgi:hypothetical protein